MTVVQQPRPFIQKKRIAALWVTALFFVVAIVVSRPLWDERNPVHDIFEMAGTLLVLTGVIGRLWSILYVGSKKNRELVTSGPYSMTRNPLYFFSMVTVVGLGVNYGSATLALLLLLATAIIFHYTARREAAYLRHIFGPTYDAYAKRVPMFWPNPFLYRNVEEVTFSSTALSKTFRDALAFVLILPALEFIELLRLGGYVSSFVTLP